MGIARSTYYHEPKGTADDTALVEASYNERRLHSALGYLSPNRCEEEQSRTPVKSAA